MAKPGARKQPGGKGRPPARGKSAQGAKKQPHRARPKVCFDEPKPQPEEPREFRLGVVPGATPGKWIDTWQRRLPHVTIVLTHLTADIAHAALMADEIDCALERHGVTNDLRAIELYQELAVVVASIESHLLAADELTLADLAGEVVMTPSDDVLGLADVPDTTAPKFASMSTEDTIQTVATGVGITIVPMSLARQHHRKDVDYRVLTDAKTTPMFLTWHADRETDDVRTFIGIVRGRTANSSR